MGVSNSTSNPTSLPVTGVSTRDSLLGIPGLLWWHDTRVSVECSGGDLVSLEDLSGNGHPWVPLVNAPACDGGEITIDFSGNAEDMEIPTFLTSVIANKPFFACIKSTGDVAWGRGNGVPRLYLGKSVYSYDTLNTITWGGTDGVTSFVHDGADIFARQNGVEQARAAIALTTSGVDPWRTRSADWVFTSSSLFDASSWTPADFVRFAPLIEQVIG